MVWQVAVRAGAAAANGGRVTLQKGGQAAARLAGKAAKGTAEAAGKTAQGTVKAAGKTAQHGGRTAVRGVRGHRHPGRKKKPNRLRHPIQRARADHSKGRLGGRVREAVGRRDEPDAPERALQDVGRRTGSFLRKQLQKRTRRTRRRIKIFVVLLAVFFAYPILAIWTDTGAAPPADDAYALVGGRPTGTLGPGPIPEALMGQVAQLTGIPIEALRAYSAAAGGDWPIDWKILAGIGKAECDHGRSTALYCSTPHNVWLTSNGGAGERGPMQHLGHLWRVGSTDPNAAHVEGPPTPKNNDSTYVATDGDKDGVADPWNWYDAAGGAARKMYLYRQELKAKGEAYDTDDFMIAAYNAGVGGATQNGPNIADVINGPYLRTVKAEVSRIAALTARLDLRPTAGYGLCPIAGKTNYTNTWGAPRSGGRSHEGVDMFAETGTPVIAMESGTVEHGSNTLGGQVYRLSADSGIYYYGAHLSAFGTSGKVAAGDVIGYVGNTGDARTTPPHLHWEVHPGGRGSAAVDPTPYADKLCGTNGANTQNVPGNGRTESSPKGPIHVTSVRAPNGTSITVNVTIEAPVRQMLEDAAAAGVSLSGSGFRSHETQIELRKAHCGRSHYAIYEMPSSQCSPPTARPGNSMHEQGLAIDFANCSSHATKCWKWLDKHADDYGFANLPSEPWHWSTNGR